MKNQCETLITNLDGTEERRCKLHEGHFTEHDPEPTHYVSDQIAEGPRCQVCGAIMTRAVGLSFYRCESCGEETQEPLLFKAIQLANVQHFGQRDKAGELYILHPLRVMLRMHTIQERIVAVLHDVVEDSEYPLSAIYTGFGHEIADAVDAVSRRVKHGRKELYLDFISRCAENPTGKAVKIADVLDNMSAERMGKLHSGMQKSLTHKYNKALRILGSAGTRETRGTPPPDMIQGGSMKFLINGSGVRVHEIELTDCELKDLGYCIQQLCEQKFIGEAAYGCTLLSVVPEKPPRETEIFWNVRCACWECPNCDWIDTAPASIIPGGHDCEKYNPREDDEIVKLHAEISLQALIEDYQKAVDGSGQHHLIAPENVKARFDELRAAAARVSQPVAPPPRPKIICLCGSTKFIEMFAVKTWELELEGNIVLGCTLLPKWYCPVRDHFAETLGVKEQRDNHHLQKIDLADEILVLNVNGYIGESTRREIEYAQKCGKEIRYLETTGASAGPAKEGA
jgi:guanosine-3',5'-bis(diphosphate) 3'-pyrophosphohydrolase